VSAATPAAVVMVWAQAKASSASVAPTGSPVAAACPGQGPDFRFCLRKVRQQCVGGRGVSPWRYVLGLDAQ
jgi:hypothetical protein